jgi:hypothetical protein
LAAFHFAYAVLEALEFHVWAGEPNAVDPPAAVTQLPNVALVNENPLLATEQLDALGVPDAAIF